MSLIPCPECGNMISDKATACPNCGCPVTHTTKSTTPENRFGESFQQRKNSNPVIWLLLLLLAVIVGSIIYILIYPSSAASDTTDKKAASDSIASVSAEVTEQKNDSYELSGQSALPPISDSEREGILSVVSEWNNNHNDYNIQGFEDVYADKVFYYTKNCSKDIILNDKVSAITKIINKYGYYSQECNNFSFKRLDKRTIRCDFEKDVNFGNNVRSYHAYLFLQKIGYDWKIVREGDTTTDRNIKK